MSEDERIEYERKHQLATIQAKALQFAQYGNSIEELKEAFTSAGFKVVPSATLGALNAELKIVKAERDDAREELKAAQVALAEALVLAEARACKKKGRS